MPRQVVLGGISASAGANIDLRGRIPAPIFRIVSAVVLQGRSVNEGGTATYDIFTMASATATKIDPYTITLDVAVTTKDLLVITYVSTTEIVAPT